jgi:hypothetical protein
MKGDHLIMAAADYGLTDELIVAGTHRIVAVAIANGNYRSRKVSLKALDVDPGDNGITIETGADPHFGPQTMESSIICDVAHLDLGVIDSFWTGHPLEGSFISNPKDDYAVNWVSGGSGALPGAGVEGSILVDAASPSYRSP